jgi:hypothetical protein
MKINKMFVFNTSTALLHQDIIINESLWHYFKTNIIMHLAVLYVKFENLIAEIW